MNNDALLHFNPVPVGRREIVSTALSFSGLPYNESTTVAVKGMDDTWHGFANCFGILLLVAREVGWTQPGLNLDLPPALFGAQPAAKTLLKIMEYNFDTVPVDAMLPGDVILMRYLDIDPRNNEPHHVGICVESPHDNTPGRLFHASQSARRAYACDFDPLFWTRIQKVLKCKYIVDDQGSND